MLMNFNKISVIMVVLALWGIVPEADTDKKPVSVRRPVQLKEN